MRASPPASETNSRGQRSWVLVSAGFHQLGGQSRANAALADYLLELGAAVHLVAHDIADKYRDHPGASITRVARLAGSDFLGYLLLRRAGRSVARRACAIVPGTRVVVNGGCCTWPDINWVHYVHQAWQVRLPGVPMWFRVKEALAGGAARRHERQALQAARLVITNSEQTRAAVIRLFDVDPQRIHNIYLGCDPQWQAATAAERTAARLWLGQPEGRPLAVFVGGLGHDERKGFDTLWASWRLLCARPDWDADLVVAGAGSGMAAWQARIQEAGLAQRIRLIGHTNRVFDVLAAADVLVSPVRYEPYGLNVQEALCRGVPALVSACAGVVEQYPAELADLILADPNSAEELAARLRRWRAAVEGWRERVRPLAETLRAYSWRAMAERMVALAEQQTGQRHVIHT